MAVVAAGSAAGEVQWDEGGLCTQDRHEADGISDVCPTRKRASLCGMRGGELLLTLDDRLLGGNVQRRHSANRSANRLRQVDQLRRWYSGMLLYCCEWTVDLLERVGDVSKRLLPPLPLLRRPQHVVGTLRTRNRRVRRSSSTIEPHDAGYVRSAVSMRSMTASTTQADIAQLTQLAPAGVITGTSTSEHHLRTCTLACSTHSGIT